MAKRLPVIRRARLADAPNLCWLQAACLPGDEPLDPSVGTWWISPVTGFVGFKDVGHKTCFLARAGVLPEAAGQGLYRRMVKTGLRHFKKLGFEYAITDCASWNLASANGLIAAGFKLFTPAAKWGWDDGLYFRMKL